MPKYTVTSIYSQPVSVAGNSLVPGGLTLSPGVTVTVEVDDKRNARFTQSLDRLVEAGWVTYSSGAAVQKASAVAAPTPPPPAPVVVPAPVAAAEAAADETPPAPVETSEDKTAAADAKPDYEWKKNKRRG